MGATWARHGRDMGATWARHGRDMGEAWERLRRGMGMAWERHDMCELILSLMKHGHGMVKGYVHLLY
jgi:hypothetical protein